MLTVHIIVILKCFIFIDAAKILGVFPTPSISHQVAFRPLTQELAKRGHDVTVITPDPIFPKGKSPKNYTEIDVHDISYNLWKKRILTSDITSGSSDDIINQIVVIFEMLTEVYEAQMMSEDIQRLLNDKTQKFDLLIIEGVVRAAMGLSHIYKAPVIQINSLGPVYNNLEVMGAPIHPMLYPTIVRQKLTDLSIIDKIKELYRHYEFQNIVDKAEVEQNAVLKRVFGPDIPPISELYNNIHMLFLNIHPLWDSNRPSPPSVIYLGGLHRNPEKELPKDLKTYLDSSKYGVIYVSFGTNVSPSALPPERISILTRVFSSLPYNVIWKWDTEELPGRSENIKISKWLPQSDLLRHPKVKLFVTQGGLQSTDEAITAGVPLLGMPMFSDQWFNVELYVRHKIGIRLDLETITDVSFRNAVTTIIEDDTYKRNINKIRTIMNDQPQQPLERAVWWTEYVLRHGGARHLRGPAANMPWVEYLELKLVSLLFIILLAVIFKLYTIIKLINSYFISEKLKKH